MENDNNVNGNLNDNSVLDALVLTREQWRSGIIKAVIFTLIAVIIFCPGHCKGKHGCHLRHHI